MNAARITIQVAVEAIANNPEGYEPATIAAVRADGEAAGISRLYLDMLPQVDES